MKLEKTQPGNILNNASSALDLLKEWLSVSESQICSTEVLSEQLPAINKLLEDSVNSISTHFGIIAENTRQIEKEIQYIDERLDSIDIAGKPIEITEHLRSIAKDTSDKETKKQLNELAKKIAEQEKSLHSELKKATKAVKSNSSEIGEVVVGLQFQDRVSQNILITVNIMRSIVSYLEKEIKTSLPSITREERRGLLDKEFAKEILQQFRLGELQTSFVSHLVNHGYIEKPEDLGFSFKEHSKQEDDDDIDLF